MAANGGSRGRRASTGQRFGASRCELAAELSKRTTAGEVATDPKPADVAPTQNVPPRPKWPPTRPHRAAPASLYRAFITAEAAKGRNTVAIYQDLVEHHGYPGAYNAVKRFVGKLRPQSPKISCRFETEPAKKRKSTTAKARSRVTRKPESIVGRGCLL